jgi:hypothetical protein
MVHDESRQPVARRAARLRPHPRCRPPSACSAPSSVRPTRSGATPSGRRRRASGPGRPGR